jgi:hypothetical protein
MQKWSPVWELHKSQFPNSNFLLLIGSLWLFINVFSLDADLVLLFILKIVSPSCRKKDWWAFMNSHSEPIRRRKLEFGNCDLCNSQTGDHFCIQCNQFLCQNCQSIHLKSTVSKEHRIKTPDILIAEAKRRQCEVHTEQFVNNYCMERKYVRVCWRRSPWQPCTSLSCWRTLISTLIVAFVLTFV